MLLYDESLGTSEENDLERIPSQWFFHSRASQMLQNAI